MILSLSSLGRGDKAGVLWYEKVAVGFDGSIKIS